MTQATDTPAAYLNRVGRQYAPHRHQTIVASLVEKFDLTEMEAEDAIREWLATRQTVN